MPSVDGRTRPLILSTRLDSLIARIEVAGNSGHRGEKKIAERMTVQTLAFVEAVPEEIRHHRFVVCERDQAVAQSPGGKHAEFFLQAPGDCRRRRLR